MRLILKFLLFGIVYGFFVNIDAFLWNLAAFVLLYFVTDYLHFCLVSRLE